jgi:hypothetical protein
MKLLSHPATILSIAPVLVLTGLAGATPAAAKGTSPYFGRWTISDPGEKVSARGRFYRTIDIAPCGKDFCGVSVAGNGTCGPTLFRFLMRNAGGKAMLKGHAKWGEQTKNVTIDLFDADDFPGKRGLDLNLGEGYNFNDRDGNIPKFFATYRSAGAAKCMAR